MILSLVLVAQVGCREQDPLARAEALVASGQATEAIELLREAIDERPEDDDLQFAYARALMAGGMRPLAEWPLRRAMRVEKWRRSAGLAIAENAMASRNLDVAIEMYSALLEDDPDDVEVLLRRAIALAATRTNLDATLEDVDRLRDLAPDDLRVFRPEIQAYLHAAMTEDAEQAIEALAERLEEEGETEDGETDRWLCVTRALFAQESFRHDEASALWEECLERHPTAFEVVSEASSFFESRGRMDRSLEIIETAVEATSLSEGLVFRAALSARANALGRHAEAVGLLEEGTTATDPETALAYWQLLATHLEGADRPEAALEATLEALAIADELDRSTPEQRFAAGDLAIRAGDLERAERLAAEVGVATFRGLLEARILHARGAYEEAVARYEEVARLWPDNAFLRYHEARAVEQLGDLDRAIELYRHATRIEATATDAQTRIAKILEAEGRFGDALSVLATQAGRGPLDRSSELLFARLLGQTVAPAALGEQIRAWQSRQPAAIVEGMTAFARGLRQRGDARAALALVRVFEPNALAQHPAGPGFAREALQAAQAAGEPSPALDALIEGVLDLDAPAPEWIAVDGLRAEHAGDGSTALARYDAALDADPSLAWVEAARARLRIDDAPEVAARVARRMLDAARSDHDLDEATALARALARRGHATRSVELYASLLARRPYDVEAAIALCGAAPEDLRSAGAAARRHAASRRLRRLGRACAAAGGEPN